MLIYCRQRMQSTTLCITGSAWFCKEKEITSRIGPTSGRSWACTDLGFDKIIHVWHQQNVVVLKENGGPYPKWKIKIVIIIILVQSITTTLLSIQHTLLHMTSFKYFFGILKIKKFILWPFFVPFEIRSCIWCPYYYY